MKRIIIMIMLLAVVVRSSGQLQVGQGVNAYYSQTPQVHNMALVALTSVPTFTLMASSRLDGFGHHPVNTTALFSAFLMDGVGVGLKVSYDQAGLSTKTDAQLAFIYRIFLNKEQGDKLSFSLAGHFVQDKINIKEAIVINPNDPALVNISQIEPNGNASASFAFLREHKYYFGFSSYQLFSSPSKFMNPVWVNAKQRHYYALGSYEFKLGEKMGLELLGIGASADFQHYEWEGGLMWKFNKMFGVGG